MACRRDPLDASGADPDAGRFNPFSDLHSAAIREFAEGRHQLSIVDAVVVGKECARHRERVRRRFDPTEFLRGQTPRAQPDRVLSADEIFEIARLVRGERE